MSELGTIKLKSMESTLFGKTHYQKRLFSVFLSYKRTKNAKTHEKHPLQRKKITLTKNKYFECFEPFTQKNAKMQAKNPIWENKKALRETCIMKAFELLR